MPKTQTATLDNISVKYYNIVMEPASRGPNYSTFAEIKLIPFMTFLHALRFPAKHHGWFYVREFSEYISQGWHETAERKIIDPRISSRQKSLHIKEQFMPIGYEIAENVNYQDRYTSLLEFCNRKQNEWRYLDMVDKRGRPIMSRALLPPKGVVDAMFADWVDTHKLYCDAFVDHIESVWSKHSGLAEVPSQPPSGNIEVPETQFLPPTFKNMGGIVIQATFGDN